MSGVGAADGADAAARRWRASRRFAMRARSKPLRRSTSAERGALIRARAVGCAAGTSKSAAVVEVAVSVVQVSSTTSASSRVRR